MSDGYVFEADMGIYELYIYATAQKQYERLVESQESFYESLYEKVVPTYIGFDRDLGRMFTVGIKTEDFALEIIDEKETYQRIVQKYNRKAEMFKASMETLDPGEQGVIRVRYLGERDVTPLSSREFFEKLLVAEGKLVKFLIADRQKQFNQMRKEHRKSLKQQVLAWRGGK